MTSYDYYKKLEKDEMNACYVGDFDKADLIADQAVAFRDQNFTKEDWLRLIDEANSNVAKIGLTKRMNKLFPETAN